MGNLMGLPSQISMRVNPPRFPYSSDHLDQLLITPDTDQIQTILVQLKIKNPCGIEVIGDDHYLLYDDQTEVIRNTMGDHAGDLMKTEQLGGDSWQRWKYSDADQDRSSGRRR